MAHGTDSSGYLPGQSAAASPKCSKTATPPSVATVQLPNLNVTTSPMTSESEAFAEKTTDCIHSCTSTTSMLAGSPTESRPPALRIPSSPSMADSRRRKSGIPLAGPRPLPRRTKKEQELNRTRLQKYIFHRPSQSTEGDGLRRLGVRHVGGQLLRMITHWNTAKIKPSPEHIRRLRIALIRSVRVVGGWTERASRKIDRAVKRLAATKCSSTNDKGPDEGGNNEQHGCVILGGRTLKAESILLAEDPLLRIFFHAASAETQQLLLHDFRRAALRVNGYNETDVTKGSIGIVRRTELGNQQGLHHQSAHRTTPEFESNVHSSAVIPTASIQRRPPGLFVDVRHNDVPVVHPNMLADHEYSPLGPLGDNLYHLGDQPQPQHRYCAHDASVPWIRTNETGQGNISAVERRSAKEIGLTQGQEENSEDLSLPLPLELQTVDPETESGSHSSSVAPCRSISPPAYVLLVSCYTVRGFQDNDLNGESCPPPDLMRRYTHFADDKNDAHADIPHVTDHDLWGWTGSRTRIRSRMRPDMSEWLANNTETSTGATKGDAHMKALDILPQPGNSSVRVMLFTALNSPSVTGGGTTQPPQESSVQAAEVTPEFVSDPADPAALDTDGTALLNLTTQDGAGGIAGGQARLLAESQGTPAPATTRRVTRRRGEPAGPARIRGAPNPGQSPRSTSTRVSINPGGPSTRSATTGRATARVGRPRGSRELQGLQASWQPQAEGVGDIAGETVAERLQARRRSTAQKRNVAVLEGMKAPPLPTVDKRRKKK